MKNLYYIVILTTALFIHSCDVVEPLSVENDLVLDDNTAIVDEATAEAALIGVYDGLNRRGIGAEQQTAIAFLTGLQGVELVPVGGGTVFYGNWFTNNIDPEAGLVKSIYFAQYVLINDANHLIDKLSNLDGSSFTGNRKNEILGEAHFLRALMYQALLVTYGQFYDVNSNYGVVLRNEPSVNGEALPRSTVRDTYDFILSDLDFAIANAPAYSDVLTASSVAAKALKARVLLYRGEGNDYQDAANIALEVINNSEGAILETNYADIFGEDSQSNEVLFRTFYSSEFAEWDLLGVRFGPLFTNLSSDFINTLSGDPRETTILVPNPMDSGTFLNGKFYNPQGQFGSLGGGASYYHLRVGEMPLVRAEALARSGASASEILEALNITQARAGAVLSTSTDINVLLEEIRVEKIRELSSEMGSTWHDLIRYSILDGLDINALKPTVISENQYIFPIPLDAVNASANIVEQNPGY